ncbi:hypothetical protein DB346_10740 [Verrucomicrobia bacterium LW23]|nr:hypothetical protein DB346_10740 [Verrucomicrobia bacterium LW23]
MQLFLLKALISGFIVAGVSTLARHNNLLASIIHSLPLISLLTFVWLYLETRDAELIGRHAYGTFWFVLPTLPMFLLMPWLNRTTGGFWQGLGAGAALSIALYIVTMALLKAGGVDL